MKTFFEKLNFNSGIFILFISVVCLNFSCKKINEAVSSDNKSSEIKKQSSVNQKLVTLEQVDQELLDKYITYKLENERNVLLINSGKKELPTFQSVNSNELDRIIDNYLVNERNSILLSTKLNKVTRIDNLNYYITPNNAVPPGDTVEAQCDGMGTVTLIIMQAIRNSNLSITFQSFTFAGLQGTMTPSGTLIQSVYNGVTTYRRNYTESYISGGVTYTQIYTLYGNIYNGQASVNIMRRTATQ